MFDDSAAPSRVIARDTSAPPFTIKMRPRSFWDSLSSTHRLHKSAQLAAHWSQAPGPHAAAPNVLVIWYHLLLGPFPKEVILTTFGQEMRCWGSSQP